MGFTAFDAPATEPAKPQPTKSGFTPFAAEPPQEPTTIPDDEGIVGRTMQQKLLGTGVSFADALGIIDQPGYGLYSMFKDSVQGSRALFKAAIGKAAGLPFGETFSEEMQAASPLPDYQHINPQSKEISDKLAEITGKGVQALGDAAYKLGRVPTSLADAVLAAATPEKYSANDPLAGSATQALATMGLIAAPAGAGKPKVKITLDPIAAFEEKYPLTAANMDAAMVGKIKRQGYESAIDSINRGLDEALGENSTPDMSLGDKVKALIMQHGPDTPLPDAIRTANAYADRWMELKRQEDLFAESVPKLAAPAKQLEAPVQVEPPSPRQVMFGYDLRNNKLPAPKKEVLDVDPEGNVIPRSESLKNRDDSAAQYQEFLKQSDKWIAEREATLSGKPRMKSQQGSIDIEGLDAAMYANNGAAMARNAAVKGALIPLQAYHGTAAEFGPGEYKPGLGIGPHFGSLGQAHQFLGRGISPNKGGLTQHMRGGDIWPLAEPIVRALDPHGVDLWKKAIDESPSVETVYDELNNSLRRRNVAAPERDAMLKPLTDHLNQAWNTNPGANIRPVDLHFKNPLRTRDLTWENPSKLAWDLNADRHITPDQYGAVMDVKGGAPDWALDPSMDRLAEDSTGISKRQQMFEAIRSALKENGYDSIVYKNMVEGDIKGPVNDSYISLDPVNQVKYRNSKEKGMIDVSGVEKNIPKAAEVVKEATGKAWAVGNPSEAATAADRALENNYKAMREKAKTISMESIRSARRAIVSHDYDLQKSLGNAGPLGEDAMLKMNVQHNATMIAKTRYDKTARAIFDDLKPAELVDLEKIIRLRRIVQIDKYKGVGTVRHEVDPVTGKSVTGPMASAALDAMQVNKGKAFDMLDQKATAYFAQEKINLTRLLQEGIIDQKLFDKMKDFDYSRTEYLDAIDPDIPIKSRITGFPQSIRSSGIPKLGRGKNAAVEMDAKLMLQESIARVENRISRNKTLNALYELASQRPENGVVALSNPKSVSKEGEVKVVPDGWVSLGVRRNGEQKNVLMREDYAQQFVTRPDVGLNTVMFTLGDNDVTLAGILRTVSGSSLLRATATKYNPAFIMAGLPMDLIHLWIAQAKDYSPHLPVYAIQIGADLMKVAPDALFRKGRWEQAMQEGMGPNFLTHETRANSMSPKTIEPALQRTRTALAFLGDFQDMWVRLAHRERLISQGVDSATATAMAVNRLNYYRGGVMTKFVDTMIPYTNIAVNGTSKAVEAMVKDPAAAAAKVAWLATGLSAAKLATMLAAPETDKAVSVEDKVRNVIVPFGDQYFILDPDGNKRYLYATVRLDQTVMPFNAAIVAGMEYAERGTVPSDIATKAMGQINPLSSMFPPTWNAYRAYADNYDPLRDGPIYNGLKVKPEDEIRNVSKGQPTGPLAQEIGGMTGLSPMRLEKATSALLNTNNFYIQAAGGALKLMFGGANPREQANSTMALLQNVPGLRSVVKISSPGIEQMKELDRIAREADSKFQRQITGLEELVFKIEQGQEVPSALNKYIAAAPPEAQEALAKHAKYDITVDQVLKQGKVSDGVPARNWWITSNQLRDDARADVFYNEWVSAEPENRRRMLGIASALQNNGTGFMSEGFKRQFQNNRKLLGDEKR